MEASLNFEPNSNTAHEARENVASKFKPGDIVQLKSGGPAMTVAEELKDYGKPVARYRCEWFKGASNERSIFEEETLKLYVSPTKP